MEKEKLCHLLKEAQDLEEHLLTTKLSFSIQNNVVISMEKVVAEADVQQPMQEWDEDEQLVHGVGMDVQLPESSHLDVEQEGKCKIPKPAVRRLDFVSGAVKGADLEAVKRAEPEAVKGMKPEVKRTEPEAKCTEPEVVKRTRPKPKSRKGLESKQLQAVGSDEELLNM